MMVPVKALEVQRLELFMVPPLKKCGCNLNAGIMPRGAEICNMAFFGADRWSLTRRLLSGSAVILSAVSRKTSE
jgi:hypothetical protein